MRALSREVPETPMLSSCSHCLTRIPRDAVIKANTRLRDQSVFMRIVGFEVTKGVNSDSVIVELAKVPEMV